MELIKHHEWWLGESIVLERNARKNLFIGQNGHGIGCGRKNVISQKTNEEFGSKVNLLKRGNKREKNNGKSGGNLPTEQRGK